MLPRAKFTISKKAGNLLGDICNIQCIHQNVKRTPIICKRETKNPTEQQETV